MSDVIEDGRPIVLRRGTVLTMNDARDVLHDADVLVVDDRIAAVGPGLEVPEGALEIDASGGIVMPGMIDTHRHMWQTALRGYGADWTPGCKTVDHADAAVDALKAVPGRFVLAYGNLQQGPWEWSTSPDFRSFVQRRFHGGHDMLGVPMAFDVTGDPAFPGQGSPPTWRLRRHDIPVSLSMDTSVWWSGDLFCAMRATLGADRSREHLEAHARQETVTNHHLRAEQVVDWATRGGSRALGMDALIGSLDDGSGATATDVEGPMYTEPPPFRKKIYEEYEGMGDDDPLFVRGSVTSTDGSPLPGAVVDVW